MRRGYVPHPWWIRLGAPCTGLYAEDADAEALRHMLGCMGIEPSPVPTEGTSTFYGFAPMDTFAADEADIKAVMRCVRLTGLHGTMRKAGTDRKWKF